MNILASLTRRFRGETLTLGLDVGSRGIKAVLMRHFANGKMIVDRASYIPLPAGIIREGQIAAQEHSAEQDDDGLDGYAPKEWVMRAVADAVREIGFDVAELDICVSPPWTGGLLVDRIVLPERSDIYIEAQKRPPFDGSDIILDHQILSYIGEGERGRQIDVLLAAARNRVVSEWGLLFRETKTEPAAFDADIFALYNAWLVEQMVAPSSLPEDGGDEEQEEGDQKSKALALLSIGMHRVVVTFVVEGEFHSSREVTGASLGIFHRTLIRRANLDSGVDTDALLRTEEAWPQSDFFKIAYRQAAADLGSGVLQAIQYFHSANPGMEIDKILISGGGACVPGLPLALSKKLDLPVDQFDPLARFGYKFRANGTVQPDMSPIMSIAFGLATRRF